MQRLIDARRQIKHGRLEQGKKMLHSVIAECARDERGAQRWLELECWRCLADIADNRSEAISALERSLVLCNALFGQESPRCVPVLEQLYRLQDNGAGQETELSRRLSRIKRRSMSGAIPDETLLEMEFNCLVRKSAEAGEVNQTQLNKLLAEVQSEPSYLCNRVISDCILVLAQDWQARARFASTFVPKKPCKPTEYNFKRNLSTLIAWQRFHDRLSAGGPPGRNIFDEQLRNLIRTDKVAAQEKLKCLIPELALLAGENPVPQTTAAIMLSECWRLEASCTDAQLANLVRLAAQCGVPQDSWLSVARRSLARCRRAAEAGEVNAVDAYMLCFAAGSASSLWQECVPLLKLVARADFDATRQNCHFLLITSKQACGHVRDLAARIYTKALRLYERTESFSLEQRQDFINIAAQTALSLYTDGTAEAEARKNCRLLLEGAGALARNARPALPATGCLLRLSARGLLKKHEVERLITLLPGAKLNPDTATAFALCQLCGYLSEDHSLQTQIVLEKIAAILTSDELSNLDRKSLRPHYFSAVVQAVLVQASLGRFDQTTKIIRCADKALSIDALANFGVLTRLRSAAFLVALAGGQGEDKLKDSLDSIAESLQRIDSEEDLLYLAAANSDWIAMLPAKDTDRCLSTLAQKYPVRDLETRFTSETAMFIYWNAARLAYSRCPPERAQELTQTALDVGRGVTTKRMGRIRIDLYVMLINELLFQRKYVQAFQTYREGNALAKTARDRADLLGPATSALVAMHHPEALVLSRQYRDCCEEAYPDNAYLKVSALTNLAKAYLIAGREQEALKTLQAALESGALVPGFGKKALERQYAEFAGGLSKRKCPGR